MWLRADRSVYRHHAHPPNWLSRLLAACLGTGGVASHRAAAVLWDLDGLRPSRPEVTVPRGAWVRRRDVRVHESSQWELIAPTVRTGIPVTGIERTLLDLAGLVPDRRLRQAVEDAVRRRLTDWSRLAKAVADHGRQGRNGTAALRRLVASYGSDVPIARSEWSNLVADLLEQGGLPRPVVEHAVVDGRFRADLDLAYPSQRVGLELDSVAWHFNTRSFHEDPLRRNHLTVLGWRILSFTWKEFVGNPRGIVDTVRAALGS